MKNIIVLVSGGGTNLQALIDAEKSGLIQGGKITCVISSKEGVYALERAKQNNIPARVVPRKEYPDSLSYSKAVLEVLNEEKADLIVLAGFMTILDRCVTKAYILRRGLLRTKGPRGCSRIRRKGERRDYSLCQRKG
mgnify:CR=1 FL=1